MEESSSSCPKETHHVTFLVVGGGIAGVTCAETIAICCPKESILLLTESSVIKTTANLEPVARYLHKFDVVERSTKSPDGVGLAPCIVTIVDQMESIEATEKRVRTKDKRTITYRYMCLCTGGRPRLVFNDYPEVIGIRDTDSVLELQRRLNDSRRIVLVGNGGIATELAHELHGVEVHWVVKDNHISSTFVDPGAAHFFLESQKQKLTGDTIPEATGKTGAVKRLRYAEMVPVSDAEAQEMKDKKGAALGPDWHRNYALSGRLDVSTNVPTIHYGAHVERIERAANSRSQIAVVLSTGELIESVDFVVSATGVDPRHDYKCDHEFRFAADGGIAVNAMMETNVAGIYAAGDVCTAAWDHAEHWFQMRLWTQARQMGAMAGRSMAANFQDEKIYQDFCFDLFGHVTQLFDFPVVLLGRYNGQGLGTDYELLLRSTPGKEYIKFVLQNGRLRGAILIGNTELAETCENLILNGIDLTPFGDDILNPDIDIEDFFD